MFRMVAIITFLTIALIGCSNDKKDIYNISIEHVKSKLKSPSSAKFEDFNEKDIMIKLNAGEDNPLYDKLMINDPDLYYRLKREGKKETLEDMKKLYKYDEAFIQGKYEAQNAFGVMLKGAYQLTLRRHEKGYCGGTPCEWEVTDYNIE